MDALYVKSVVLSSAHCRNARYRENIDATRRRSTVIQQSGNSCDADKIARDEKRNEVFTKQLLLHVGGSNGSGKSTLARDLGHELRHICGSKNKVLVVAPTKRTAAVIGGITIYAALSLSIATSRSRRRSVRFSNHPVSQSRYSELEWLIFDDVCIVSAELLNELHYVLCHTKNCSEPFGGVNAVIIGDLLHLPPVNGSRIFEAKFWKQFRYVFLEQRFRSRNDSTLTSICTSLNVGSLKVNEMAKNAFLSRRSFSLTSEEIGEFQDALHLFPGKAAAEEMNYSRAKINAANTAESRVFLSHDIFLQQCCSSYCDSRELRNEDRRVLDAEPSLSSVRENDIVIYDTIFGYLENCQENYNFNSAASRLAFTRKAKMCQKDVHGLPREIVIRVGDVVFFQTSVEFEEEKYLVNEGATGTVIAIRPYITVSLYLSDIGKRVRVNVGQVSVIEQMSDNVYLRRTQIPFTVKCASTIHSVQGLTLNRVILHLNRLFCSSLAYAALATVQKLNDVIIAELNVKSLFGNAPGPETLREYHRLKSIREKLPFYVKNMYCN